MKKILGLILTLAAMHFIVIAIGAAYLVGAGRLNKTSASQIKDVLFPQPATQPATTQPTNPEASEPDSPMIRLEALLAKQASRPATEQVEFVRAHFDEQFAQLDRRQRDLRALQDQVESSRSTVERDRKALTARETAMTQRETEASQAESDKGFQSEISLYTSMPPAQVKKVFLGMEDAQAAKYLQALPPRTATKILKEFKAPEEVTRMSAILESIRKASNTAATTPDATTPGSPAPKPAAIKPAGEGGQPIA